MTSRARARQLMDQTKVQSVRRPWENYRPEFNDYAIALAEKGLLSPHLSLHRGKKFLPDYLTASQSIDELKVTNLTRNSMAVSSQGSTTNPTCESINPMIMQHLKISRSRGTSVILALDQSI